MALSKKSGWHMVTFGYSSGPSSLHSLDRRMVECEKKTAASRDT